MVRAYDERLQLSYSVKVGRDEWHRLDETVDIHRAACPFGGSRPYFVCPGRLNGVCGRRVIKLYTGGQYFLCRHCLHLSYACQREQPWDRKARRAVKIRERLGGEPGIYCPFPEKPAGMWWRTYDRLTLEANDAASAAEQALLDRCSR